MINWIKSLFTPIQILGALEDNRFPLEKESDYRIEELVTTPTKPVWKELKDWKKYPISNQNGSGSCVAQSLALMLGIHQKLNGGEFIPFSATHIYQRRYNRPNPGMWSYDAFNIGQQGVTLEQLTPSQEMTDNEMDSTFVEEYKKQVGKVFSIGNYIFGTIRDIESVASVMQATGKPVMVWYRFDYNEWGDVPEVRTNNPRLHHSVTAIAYGLYKGKKALVIQDSWGKFGKWNGYRIITEDFHNKRNSFSAHFMNFKYAEKEAPKPKYIEGDIVSLQDCLKHYGTFPANVESTGYLGGITWKAVRDFQVKEGLHPTGVNSIGPATTKRLKELY